MKNATKISCLLTILVTNPTHIQAFAPSSFSGRKSSPRLLVVLSAGGYVPDGLSPAEYNKIKEADKKKVGKNLGKLGPRGFKSRSMQAWQEAYESGHAGHTFAPIDYKKMLQQGKIKKEEVPYMVRGGSWDNSDVKGAKKIQWSKKDKEYAAGGYKKEQSVSILGSGPGFDWTGTQSRDPNAKRSFPGLS